MTSQQLQGYEKQGYEKQAYEKQLYEKFTSNQNKGMVWSLLCADIDFKTIPDQKANIVKKDFDQKIETIARQITPTDNLVILCKRIISDMINDIEKYKGPEKMTLGYNAAEISQNRQKIFQEELTTKKKDFETFNAPPAPAKIDFSDNLDSPIGELDKMLAEQIALREKQLNMVLNTQDKEAASKWIQNEGKKPEGTYIKPEGTYIKLEGTYIKPEGPYIKPEEPPKLKIGEEIVRDTKLKRVNFADTLSSANDDNDFMTLLKKTTRTETSASIKDTDTLLREILNKQNQILELLTKKL
jgi:hypothetical protein